MDPGTQLSLFTGAWRYPGINPGLSGMDLSQVSQAAYRYNQNMMEYYTCKSELGHFTAAINNPDIYGK